MQKLSHHAPPLAHVGNAEKCAIDRNDYTLRTKGDPAMHRRIRVQSTKAGMYRISFFQNVQSVNAA